MKVQGVEISEAALDAVKAWIARQPGGFTFGRVALELSRAGVPYAVAKRAADRLLQQMSRSGLVEFSRDCWCSRPAPTQENAA
jgi:hypothetical protein